jgi:fucose permease
MPTPDSPNQLGTAPRRPRVKLSGAALLTIAYLGFVSLGLPDPVAGVAWPSVREVFGLQQASFGLVFIALGCGYCASGFLSGKLTQTLGIGNLLWISSGFVALAMLGSGLAPAWPMFVACAVVWGIGSGGIDGGLNHYASTHFSPRHVNWLHACYSVGATLGPLLMTAVLVGGGSWRSGYGVVGIILLAMTLTFFVTRNSWTDDSKSTDDAAQPPVTIRDALSQLLVWLQIALFFVYVGIEFTVGQWSFTLLTESRHVHADVAGILAGGYYGMIGVGRVLAGVVSHRIGLDTLVRFALLTVVIGTLLFAFGSPVELSCAGLALIGLGLAPFFPCLMARTPQRLGAFSTHAVGFQVSAGMVGAALMPGLAGVLAERVGLEAVPQFCVLLAAFLFATHELTLYVANSRSAAD